MMEFDTHSLYVFFENHKRNGWVNKYFGSGVRKHALQVRMKIKSKQKTVNHIGFLFYDNKQWKIAELDYFAGGRIIRNASNQEMKSFALRNIAECNNSVRDAIYTNFPDEQQIHNWWYSFRRYNFAKCVEYCKNTKHTNTKLATTKLYTIHFLQAVVNAIIRQPSNAGHTCVEVVFTVMNECNFNPFKTKLSPYELLVELHETHPQTRQ